MPPIRRRGKRGPYKMHLRDPAIPMARTTEWLRRTTEERLQQEGQDENQMLANVDIAQEIHLESGDEGSSVLSDSEAGSSSDESEVQSSSADGSGESAYVELNESAESGDPEDSISSALSCALSESALSHAESDEFSVFAIDSDVEPGTEDENDSSSSLSVNALSVVSSSSSGSDEEEHPFMQDIRQHVLVQHEEREGRGGGNQILYQQENIERQPLYVGAQISKEESDILIMSFIIRWGLEEKGIEDLLRLIDCHLPASTLGSKYTFLKKFPTPPTMKVRYFCPDCSGLLPSDMDEVQCHCGYICVIQELKDAGSDFFVQLSISDQIKQIMSNRKLVGLLRKECQESDVINGKVYKRLRNKGIIADNDLSIQFNCDGVKPFKSSKVSIYPVQACLNEMPFRQRRDNMILCGLFYGKKKTKHQCLSQTICG